MIGVYTFSERGDITASLQSKLYSKIRTQTNVYCIFWLLFIPVVETKNCLLEIFTCQYVYTYVCVFILLHVSNFIGNVPFFSDPSMPL